MATEEQRLARIEIRNLEHNSKHTKADPIASAQTVPDALDDPKHNRETPLDPRWKKAKKKRSLIGRVAAALRADDDEVWIDPDAEGEDE